MAEAKVIRKDVEIILHLNWEEAVAVGHLLGEQTGTETSSVFYPLCDALCTVDEDWNES